MRSLPILMFLAVLSICIPVAAEPIPADSEIMTNAEYNRQRHAADRRRYVEMYKQFGQRKRAWDANAVALVEMWTDCLYQPANDRAETVASVQRRALTILKQGCEDPLITYIVGWTYDVPKHNSGAETYLRRAAARFENSMYPSIAYGVAASRLARYLEAWHKDDEAAKFHQIAADAFFDDLIDPLNTEDPRLRLIVIRDNLDARLPADIAEKFCDKLKEQDNVDPWLREMALGILERRLGWEARGTGFAHNVTDDGWRRFRIHLTAAREHLERAYEMYPDRPEAAGEMIAIAMAGYAQGEQDERYWFDRSVRAQIDWPPAYSSMLWAMRPRWGGSYDQMYEFGLECADTGRYDTKIPYQLIQAIIEIGEDKVEDDDQAFSSQDYWHRPGLYERATEVLGHYVEQPLPGESKYYYQSLQLGIAFSIGRWDDVNQLLSIVGDHVDAEALSKLGCHVDEIVQAAQIYRLGLTDFVLEIDELMMEGDFDKAIARLEGARSAAGDTESAFVLLDFQRAIDIYRELQTGEWVALRFEPGLPGWTVRAGACQVIDDRRIKAGSGQNGMRLVCDAPIGGRWEMRGSVDLHYLQNFRKEVNVGFLMNYARAPRDDDYWQQVAYYPSTTETVASVRNFNNRRTVKKTDASIPSRGSHSFHLKVWDGAISFSFNEFNIFTGAVPRPRGGSLGPQLGLGIHRSVRSGFVVYENLELRLLTEQPEEITDAMVEEAGIGPR